MQKYSNELKEKNVKPKKKFYKYTETQLSSTQTVGLALVVPYSRASTLGSMLPNLRREVMPSLVDCSTRKDERE